MGDWNKPTTSSDYSSEFIQELDARLDDAALQNDPAKTTVTNPPTDMIRWSSASAKWQIWSGSWGDLAATYAISISGLSGTATALATGRTFSVSGDATGTSGAFDGTGNATIPVTLATVSAAKGGTGQAGGYTVGDLIYASGASTISKLVDVAVGNVIISGGVGVAPSYGKVTLTTHVDGVLPVANGGSSFSSYSVGDLIYASGTTTLAKLAAAAATNVLKAGTPPSWGKVVLSTDVSGVLGVPNGGSGAASLTGLLVGNGASAFTAVAAPSGTVVGTTDSQTLSNKTLTNPAYTRQMLTDASTISWDADSGAYAYVTITATRTMGAPTNLAIGPVAVEIIQGGSGGYDITWNSIFHFPGGVAPVLSTGVGDVDLISGYYNGTYIAVTHLKDVG